jgi:hypothetical protein
MYKEDMIYCLGGVIKSARIERQQSLLQTKTSTGGETYATLHE